MNRVHTSAATAIACATPAEAAELALDDLLGEGLRGSESALHTAAYELRGRIIMDVSPILEAGDCEQDAEDVADDTLLDVLEGNVRARRGPGKAIAAVMRRAREIATDYVAAHRENWGIDEDE